MMMMMITISNNSCSILMHGGIHPCQCHNCKMTASHDISSGMEGRVVTSLCGKPLAEKIGIFCPRAILFMPSMADIPV